MRNHVAVTDWRTYLDASLFPLKIYTVLAVIWIMAWHAYLPTYHPHWGTVRPWDFGLLPDSTAMATDDFYTFASFVAAGYLLSGLILLAGGIIQAGFCSRRAWMWSLSFAVAALAIGISMAHFAGGIARFEDPLNDILTPLLS